MIHHPLHLEPSDTTLVVIDIQERLAGAMKKDVLSRTVKNTRILIEGMKILGCKVIVTEQYPKGLGRTLADVREPLGEDFKALEKVEFNCSDATGFLGEIKGASCGSTVLTGMEAHVCVLQTAAGLIHEGLRVWVAEDAVCSRSKSNWQSALRLLDKAGAVVAPTEAILFMLLGKAGSPEFKAISQLVK